MSEKPPMIEKPTTKLLTDFVEAQAAIAQTWELDNAHLLGFLGDALNNSAITLDYLVHDWSDTYADSYDESLPATRLKDHSIRFNLQEQTQDAAPNQQSVIRPTEFSVDLDGHVVFLFNGVEKSKNDITEVVVLINRLTELEAEEHLRPVTKTN